MSALAVQLDHLLELLRKEGEVLNAGDVQQLAVIAETKATAVEAVRAHLVSLNEVCPPHLLDRVIEAEALNATNGTLLAVRLSSTRSTLTSLRRLFDLDDLTSYSPNGALRARREQRGYGTS